MNGATVHRNQLEVTNDIGPFYRRIGLLCTYPQLEWLGFYLDNSEGMFTLSQSRMLLEFCRDNPEYHVVTCTHPGRLENRYVPGKNVYLLAEGDKNPNLVLDMFWKKNACLLEEEMFDQALAIASNVDRSHKGELSLLLCEYFVA